MDLIFALSLIDVVILGSFAIIRTYVNYKSLRIQQTMLEESRRYWGSWKERSKDVAEKVLSEISTADLRTELKRRSKRRKKECPTPIRSPQDQPTLENTK